MPKMSDAIACALKGCRKTFKRTHNRQLYCSPTCSAKAREAKKAGWKKNAARAAGEPIAENYRPDRPGAAAARIRALVLTVEAGKRAEKELVEIRKLLAGGAGK